MSVRHATLADVCTVVGGGTPTRSTAEYYGGRIPWVTPKDMKTWEIHDAQVRITEAGLENSATRQVPPNSVLVVVRSGVLKHTVPVAINRVSVAINQDMKALLCAESADPDYVARFIKARSPVILQWVRATTADNFPIDKLKRLEIPLPPLPEQRRIAEILNKADELRAKRRAALAQLDTLPQSLFLDIFGEKLGAPAVDTRTHRANVPRGCSWVLLTDVARLATGHTPDRERAEYWNGEIPWISLTDIRSLNGAEATSTLQTVTPLGIENSSSVLLPKGTVCFSRTASVGFVTVMGREMATSQDFMNWVCGPSIDPIYLMWSLITSRQRLLALSSGSTHRTIYMRVVEQFRVLLPPIQSQREFARRVAAAGKPKASHHASLAELDALFSSVQHRAFRGEL